MASSSENTTDVLKELKNFVQDRKQEYQNATNDSDNPLFKQVYQKLVAQQATFADELTEVIGQAGSELAAGSSESGEYYRQWMEKKATFISRDEQSIVEFNIDGEEWAQKAYTNALENHALPQPVREVVEKQREISLQTLTQLNGMKISD